MLIWRFTKPFTENPPRSDSPMTQICQRVGRSYHFIIQRVNLLQSIHRFIEPWISKVVFCFIPIKKQCQTQKYKGFSPGKVTSGQGSDHDSSDIQRKKITPQEYSSFLKAFQDLLHTFGAKFVSSIFILSQNLLKKYKDKECLLFDSFRG